MSSESQQSSANTPYGAFVQSCWSQHTPLYPPNQLSREIDEFNKQCSVWWYNMSQQERDIFVDIAHRANNDVQLVQLQPQAQAQPVENNAQVPMIRAMIDPATGNVFHYETFYDVQLQPSPQQPLAPPPVPTTPPTLSQEKPPRPKKPLSSFFLYTQDHREEVKSAHPEFSITQVSKELGQRWAVLEPEVKKGYEERYLKDRKRYEEELRQYQPLTPPPSATPAPQPVKYTKKRDKDAPKHPLSPYLLFAVEEQSAVQKEFSGIKVSDLGRELGRRWRSIDQNRKSDFQRRAAEAREEYKRQLAEYLELKKQNNGKQDVKTETN